MRKFLPFLFAAALASSCIDNAYDLSNVNTDDVTIGDEDSEYRLPLATVYVSMSELNEGGADIKTLFDEADIWLPSPLPGNAAYVDLRELQNTPETITPLLDALIDQMMDDDAKITAVADLLGSAALPCPWWRRRSVWIGAALLLASGASRAAVKPCEELKAEIETKIQAAGVTSYTLEIVDKSEVKDPNMVVGTCDGASLGVKSRKRIVCRSSRMRFGVANFGVSSVSSLTASATVSKPRRKALNSSSVTAESSSTGQNQGTLFWVLATGRVSRMVTVSPMRH